MAFSFVLASVSYGLLCSICSLFLGGTVLNALVIYLVSGQLAMITLIGRAYFRFGSDTRRQDG